MTEVESSVAAAASLLEGVLGERLEHDVPLAAMTTYRVGGNAALFVDVDSIDDLLAVARARVETGVPILVIGRGSNMLVADEGFGGIAISIANLAGHIDIPGAGTGPDRVVTAGGGVALPVLRGALRRPA